MEMENYGSRKEWARRVLGAQWFDAVGFEGEAIEKVDKKKAGHIYDRLIKHENRKVEDLHRMQMQKLYEERENCTFQPELVSMGIKKHQNRNNSKSMNPVALRNSKELHERVDEIIKERNMKVAMIKADEAVAKEEQFKDLCTFKPKINKNEQYSQLSRSKIADMDSWKQKLQDRLFEEYFDSKSNVKPTFQPTISKNSEKLLRAKTPEGRKQKVEDRLYNLSKSKSGKAIAPQSPVMNRSTSMMLSTSHFCVKPNIDPALIPGAGRRVITVAELCADIEKHKSVQRSNSALSKKNAIKSPIRSPFRTVERSSRQSSLQKPSETSTHPFDSTEKENSTKPTHRLKKRNADQRKEVKQPTHELVTNCFTLCEEQGSVLSELPLNQSVSQQIEVKKNKRGKNAVEASIPSKCNQGSQQSSELHNAHPSTTTGPSISTNRTDFDMGGVPAFLTDILSDSKRTKLNTLLPKDCTRTKPDGRQYVKFGEQKIFYKDDDLLDIINFSLRAKTFC
jgi:hypothetical protein